MKNLAKKYHAGQFRKGKEKLPYIVHPQSVAETLIAWGEDPASPAVQIAWGHDLLEDTQVPEEEIIAASSEYVLNSIKHLTRPQGVKKSVYLQTAAACGIRDVLLVKTADRICNTRDFVKLKNQLHAYRYLHEADCLVPELEKLSGDTTAENALSAWKNLNSELEDAAHRDAVRGCFLGGAVGDALGAPVEFMSRREIFEEYGKDGITDYVEFYGNQGSITDDTQMTLFTAEGILRAIVRENERGVCSPEGVVHFAYLRWLKTQGTEADCPECVLDSGWLIKEKQLFQRRAPGNTCINSLKYPKYAKNNNSKGCGTVMRMAPAGIRRYARLAYESGCDFSALTHSHPTGITSGGAFAMLIAYLYNGKALDEALDLVENHLKDIPDAAETLRAIQKARTAESIEELGEGWVAEEALAIGIFCTLKYPDDFKSAVLAAVNITGDSDSTAAIAGNISGVINGESSIPQNWLGNLRELDIVSRLADDFHQKFEAGEDGETTPEWWDKYPGF